MMALMVFSLVYAALVLSAILLLSRYKNKIINWKIVSLYISFMALGGPSGEIIVGTLYEAIFGQPLWQYQFYPVHNGYTSYVAPVIWGLSGGVLYISHEIVLAKKNQTTLIKSSFTMVETILVEVFINLSVLMLAGSLLFYYTPGDLRHVTSLQTLPFYFLLGLVIDKSIERFRQKPGYFSGLFMTIAATVMYVAS